MLTFGENTVWTAAEDRYETMPYRRVGDSGLKLPALSLGLWHNFGDDIPLATMRAPLRRAFDLGITHFDLANNYGPPAGSAELNFGRILREDFARYRQELVISTKAGWQMWPGPYGGVGGSRKYLLDSIDQSLERMGLDRVDIFYHHRPDPDTPLEETMGALDHPDHHEHIKKIFRKKFGMASPLSPCYLLVRYQLLGLRRSRLSGSVAVVDCAVWRARAGTGAV